VEPIDRLVEVRALEHVEADDPLVGLGERPLGHEQRSLPASYDARLGGRPQPLAEHPDPGGVVLLHPLVDRLGAGRVGVLGPVRVGRDEHQELHVSPPVGSVSPR